MDLLKQIFFRFDGENIVELRHDLPELDLWEWIRKRTGLSEERLRSYSASPLHIALYLGDVISHLFFIIPHRMHMARLAFLNRADLYVDYRVDRIDLDFALMSGNPQIQLHAVNYSTNKFNILDLEIIPWTEELIQYYNRLISGLLQFLRSKETLMLAGYLHIQMGTMDDFNKLIYLTGYCISEMQFRPDRFAQIPEIDRLLTDVWINHHRDIYIASGYFPPTFINSGRVSLKDSLVYVWPDLTKRFSGDASVLEELYISISIITHSLIRRAREMLRYLDELGMSAEKYRAQLNAICGLHVDPKYLNLVMGIMISVAHPQVDLDIIPLVNLTYETSVYYNLVNYFRKIDLIGSLQANPRLVLSEETKRKLSALYMTGELLEVYSPDQISMLAGMMRD